jgi:hypothetical protein
MNYWMGKKTDENWQKHIAGKKSEGGWVNSFIYVCFVV